MISNVIAVLFLLTFSAAGLTENSDGPEIVPVVQRLRSAPRVKRIIGGSYYNKGEWPWLVSLKGKIPSKSWGWFTTSYKHYYCGGSLVSDQWVLSAAHCFRVATAPSGISNPKYWHIKAGDVKRTLTGVGDRIRRWWDSITQQKTASWWYVHATKIIIHPQYDANNKWLNDIALIKLDRKLPISDNSHIDVVGRPTNIPSDWPPAGANCSMQGWGCTYDGGPLQEYAKTVTLPVVSAERCAQVYGDLGPTRLCAGYSLANKGICKGDSGGPLACKDGTVWKQAGIASFASGGKSGNWPGAFTRVSEYTSWIAQVIASN